MALIDVQGLTRSFRTYKKAPGFSGALKGLFHREYETVFAVKDVSFQVEEGEFVGFLGPNGAGKTTTLKMLAGLLYPTSGTASVLGYVPWERADAYRRTVDEMSELLGVRDKLSTAVRELSLGERMKCELIAALLHEPKVLFLDEPTIGLDVVSQKVVREFLREHNKRRKTTILLTSHYMADIQELCDRVIIIDRGTVFFDGRLNEILDRFAGFKIITVTLEQASGFTSVPLAELGEVLEQSPASARLKVARESVIATCKVLLDRLPVKDFAVEEVPIEDIIRQVFEGR